MQNAALVARPTAGCMETGQGYVTASIFYMPQSMAQGTAYTAGGASDDEDELKALGANDGTAMTLGPGETWRLSLQGARRFCKPAGPWEVLHASTTTSHPHGALPRWW